MGTGEVRDSQGRFVPGVSGNPEGMKPETLEQKLVKKALKEIVADYKDKLTEALPKIEPILVAKAIRGDMIAIKELHDRVMGKPQQYLDHTSAGRPLPILGNVQQNHSHQPDSSPQEAD